MLIDGRVWAGPNWVTRIWTTGNELWITVSGPTTLFTTAEEIQIPKSRGGACIRVQRQPAST